MLAKDCAFGLGMGFAELLKLQPKLEPRSLPRHPENFVAIDFFRQRFPVLGRSQ
jgi:hypothetical protein